MAPFPSYILLVHHMVASFINPLHHPHPRESQWGPSTVYIIAPKPAAFTNGRENTVFCFGHPFFSRPELDLKLFYTCCQAVSQSASSGSFQGPHLSFPDHLHLLSQTHWPPADLGWGTLVSPPCFLGNPNPRDPGKWEALTPKIQGVLSVFHDLQTEGLLVGLTLWPCPWQQEPPETNLVPLTKAWSTLLYILLAFLKTEKLLRDFWALSWLAVNDVCFDEKIKDFVCPLERRKIRSKKERRKTQILSFSMGF